MFQVQTRTRRLQKLQTAECADWPQPIRMGGCVKLFENAAHGTVKRRVGHLNVSEMNRKRIQCETPHIYTRNTAPEGRLDNPCSNLACAPSASLAQPPYGWAEASLRNSRLHLKHRMGGHKCTYNVYKSPGCAG